MQQLDSQTIVLILLSLLVIAILPLGYIALNRAPRPTRAVLLVSTDDAAKQLVTSAARRVGYATAHVYRYEDGLQKLKQDAALTMIIVDDSVPQYEAGLLLSALQRSPIGIRPLILITDGSELDRTAPSYRAEAVVSRPLTEKAIESAIRKVSERISLLEMD
jgi:CheY-like chemotaxis protein